MKAVSLARKLDSEIESFGERETETLRRDVLKRANWSCEALRAAHSCRLERFLRRRCPLEEEELDEELEREDEEESDEYEELSEDESVEEPNVELNEDEDDESDLARFLDLERGFG